VRTKLVRIKIMRMRMAV